MFGELFLNPQYHSLKNFEFSSGEILEEAVVEYVTIGSPKYNESGEIINAIIYCHGSSGDCCSIRRIKDLTTEGGPFDANEYYLISLSALGSPGSSAPSNTDLNHKFPHYTIKDMVNFQIKFLKEKFNINHVNGLIGNSMGGFEVLTWASEYSDYADFVVSLVSSYKTAGQNYALSKQLDNLISSDLSYGSEGYDVSLNRTLKLAYELMYSFGFSKEYYRNLSNYEIDLGIEEIGDEGLCNDLNDIKYRNEASMKYDIEEKLDQIKAKVLIIGINQDQYFPPELDAIPMHDLIEDSTLVLYDSYLGHVGSNEVNKVEDEIFDFLGTVNSN